MAEQLKPGDKVRHKRYGGEGVVKRLSASGKMVHVEWTSGRAPRYGKWPHEAIIVGPVLISSLEREGERRG